MPHTHGQHQTGQHNNLINKMESKGRPEKKVCLVCDDNWIAQVLKLIMR